MKLKSLFTTPKRAILTSICAVGILAAAGTATAFAAESIAKSNSIDETVLSLLEKLKEDQHEVITLYYGEGVTEEDAKALSEKVQEAFPDCDVDYHFGGQPVYYYLLSLE